MILGGVKKGKGKNEEVGTFRFFHKIERTIPLCIFFQLHVVGVLHVLAHRQAVEGDLLIAHLTSVVHKHKTCRKNQLLVMVYTEKKK